MFNPWQVSLQASLLEERRKMQTEDINIDSSEPTLGKPMCYLWVVHIYFWRPLFRRFAIIVKPRDNKEHESCGSKNKEEWTAFWNLRKIGNCKINLLHDFKYPILDLCLPLILMARHVLKSLRLNIRFHCYEKLTEPQALVYNV